MQKEILKKMGNPIPQNYLYTNVKLLLERVAPLMIDSMAIMALVKFVDEAVGGMGDICDEMADAVTCGMKLLLVGSTCVHGGGGGELDTICGRSMIICGVFFMYQG